jgi:type I restriction enzyme S subunit
MTNFSGKNLNVACDGHQGGGMVSRRNALEHIVPEGYKLTDVGSIPKYWEITKIKNVANVIDSLHKTPRFSETGFSMVRVADIRTGNLNLEKTLKVNKSVFVDFTRNYTPKKGDIVLSRVGSYGVSSYVETDEPFCIGQNTVVIDSKISSRYLYYILNSPSTRTQIEDGSYGSGYKSLSLKNIIELQLPLPIEKEQTAIANALSDVDALLTELENLIAKKQAIKTASMQQLLTGKTRLPQFATHTEGEKKGQLKDTKPSELGEIPEDWDVQPLSKLSTYINDGTHHTPTYKRDGIPFYSVENVSANDFYNVKFISEEEHKKLVKRCRPEKGDILMTRIGTLGITRVIDWEVDASIYVSLALIKLRQEVKPEYVYSFSKSSIFQKEVEKRSLINATPQKINMVEIGQVPILFPTNEEEQTTITTILSDMDNEIQTLEQRLKKTRQIKQGMMQELLTGKTRLPF